MYLLLFGLKLVQKGELYQSYTLTSVLGEHHIICDEGFRRHILTQCCVEADKLPPEMSLDKFTMIG